MKNRIRLSGEPVTAARARHLPEVCWKRVGLALAFLLAASAAAGILAWWGQRALFLEKRAQSGEPEAQYLFGKRCFGQATCREEQIQSVEWLTKAAEQGHVKAQTALGVIYARGMGAAQEPELAVHWLTRAALQGDPLAQNELATIYAKGRGVRQDLGKAIHWYSQAASAGSRQAEQNLALATIAQAKSIGDITTRAGKRFRNVILRKVEADSITVAYRSGDGGVGLVRLKAEELPPNLAVLCSKDATDGTGSGFSWSRLDVEAAQM